MPEIPSQPIQPQTPPVVAKPSGFNWKSVLIAVLIGAVVIVAAVAGLYYYLNQKQSSLETGSVTIKSATPSAKTATSSAKPDETVNWKNYTDPNGPSFKYPSTWTLKKINDQNLSIGYAIQITSPTDFSLYFTLMGGMGCGCGEDGSYYIDVNVYSIKPAGYNNSKGTAVVIIEESLSGGIFAGKGENFARKELLVGESGSWRKIGDNGKECLCSYSDVLRGAFEVNYNNGTNLYLGNLFFGGSYPDDSKYQKMSIKDYFNLPDVKTAEEVMSSVKL